MEKFGEGGIAALALAMNIPVKTWENLEGGVALPAWVILKFIVLTRVEPHWLMTGEGERYRARSEMTAHRASS